MSEERDHLDQDIAAMYRAQSLPPERMEALLKDIANSRRPMRMRIGIGAVAAAIAACLAVVVYMHNRPLTARDVAEDVQRHHVKTFVADVTAADFASLASQMSKLDFTPVLPAKLKDEPLNIIGARYCNLGHTQGMQIRYRDSHGQVMTLCEFKAADVNPIGDGEFKIDGYDISVWHENGLVIAKTNAGA